MAHLRQARALGKLHGVESLGGSLASYQLLVKYFDANPKCEGMSATCADNTTDVGPARAAQGQSRPRPEPPKRPCSRGWPEPGAAWGVLWR